MYVYVAKPNNFPTFLPPFKQRFWVHASREFHGRAENRSDWKPCVSSAWTNQVPWKETKNGVPYPSLKRRPSHWRKKAECREVCGFRKHKYILYFPAKPLRKRQIETGSPAGSLRNDCCSPFGTKAAEVY